LSVADRRQLIKRNDESLSTARKCELIDLNRSSYYFEPQGETEETFALMRQIDRIYTDHPYYGSRRIEAVLRREGTPASRDRIVRLMRLMGIEGKQPGRRTTKAAPGHKVYPNLLKNLKVDRPGQVWCSDITYLPMPKGTMYLVAIMDWHSRCVLSRELSNSLDSDFCVRALERALDGPEKPEVFHSDQGCQYTSQAFTGVLQAHGIAISMSGRGRAYDNIFIERFWRSLKHEEIYKHEYESAPALRQAVDAYINFYNLDRPHQALDYHTPWETHLSGLAIPAATAHSDDTQGRAQPAIPAPPTSYETHSRGGRAERARSAASHTT
jgi:putative transposase